MPLYRRYKKMSTFSNTSLSSALSNASQGLNYASKATELISSNIANAQTPGYVRRTMSAVEGSLGGVNSSDVTRNVSYEATYGVRRSQVTYQQQNILSQSMQKIVDAIGAVDSDYSLAGYFDSFMDSLKNLAETPENGVLQSQAVNEASLFAKNVRDIATSMQDIRQQADSAIDTEVKSINNALKQLKEVSQEVVAQKNSGDISNLLDEQDRLIDKISESIPINVSYNNDGSVRLSTKSGLTLLDLTVTELAFSPTTNISPEFVYAYDTSSVSSPYNPTLSGLKIGGVDVTPTADKIQSIDGGRLGGLFKVRDEFTVTTQKQIDALAANLITAFRDGDSTVTTGDSLFTSTIAGKTYTTPDDMVGVANNFTINSAIDPDQGGDKRRIRDGAEATIFGPEGNDSILRNWMDEVEAVRTFDSSTDLSASQNISSAVREFVSYASLKNENEKDIFQFESGKLNSLLDVRDNLQGVNIDEEMNNMLQMQRLYSANAVLLRTTGEMLEIIINI